MSPRPTAACGQSSTSFVVSQSHSWFEPYLIDQLLLHMSAVVFKLQLITAFPCSIFSYLIYWWRCTLVVNINIWLKLRDRLIVLRGFLGGSPLLRRRSYLGLVSTRFDCGLLSHLSKYLHQTSIEIILFLEFSDDIFDGAQTIIFPKLRLVCHTFNML